MRQLRYLLFILLASALLLEVVLQGLALFLHQRNQRPQATHSGEPSALHAGDVSPTILCVGDSHTFGIGAETQEFSYPSQLQNLITEAFPESGWRTANSGWPGQNSREVLINLQSQLEEHSPAITCILIGVNDFWSVPEPLTEAETAEGTTRRFKWQWRTGRLLTLLMAQKNAGSMALENISAGNEAPLDEDPSVNPPSPKIVPKVFQDPPYPYAHDPISGALKEAAREGLTEGDAAKIIENATKALELYPEDPQTLQLLIWAETLQGNRVAVDEHLATMERLYKEDPEYWLCREMIWALLSAGERVRRREIALEMTESHPEYSFFWSVYAFESSEVGEFEIAMKASDNAISLNPRPEDYDMREKIFNGAGKHEEAVTSLIQLFLTSGDDALFLNGVRARPHPEEFYTKIINDHDCTDDERAELNRLHKLAFQADDDAVLKILNTHLTNIISMCREHHSEPVLMTYAMDVPSFEQNTVGSLVVSLAEAQDVTCIDHNAHFRELAKSRSISELMAHDGGHVNDEGYSIMAQNIFDQLRASGRFTQSPDVSGATPAE